MTKKKVIVQIFTGGYKKSTTSFSKIKNVMDELYKTSHIDAVILGWCTDKNLYKNITEYLKTQGTYAYLWLPVFSETGLLKEVAPVVDSKKRQIQHFALKETENFEFYCPSHQLNSKAVKQIYEENFQDINFDGIFLDKIRYPSFSNGKDSIFTCFCEKCEQKMIRTDIDIKALKQKIKAIDDGVYGDNPLGIDDYNKLNYILSDDTLEKFFLFKQNNINEAVEDLYNYFSSLGLKVGLDLLSPFVGYFSGQSAEDLVKYCDFIKPMFYRATFAPAGMPFELGKYEEGFLKDSNQDRLKEVLNLKDYTQDLFPLDFMARELDDLADLKKKHPYGLFPGIEVNRIPGVADISPDYIKETINEINKHDVDGIVMSWDMLSAPGENLKTTLEVLFDSKIRN